MMLGMASRMEWDKQGRVLFPEKFMKRSGLVREVTLVGNRDHLEIWARPAWDEEKQKMEARRSEIILRGQQDLPPLTPS
jgi:MraZ protein